MTPNLVLTVSRKLWDDIAESEGGAYADSYLSGAIETDGRLLPRTKIAWNRLRERAFVQKIIRDNGLVLIEPPYYVA
jgi:hypothetical protein